MKKVAFAFVVALMLMSCGRECRVTSVDGRVRVIVGDSLMTVWYAGVPVQVIEHELGHWDHRSCSRGVETYELVSGKRKVNSDRYQECCFQYADGSEMQLRVFNDGVALRMLDGDTRISFRIPDGTRRWMQNTKQDYEAFYPLQTSAHDGTTSFPALLEYGDGVFGLITESGVGHGMSCSYLTCSGEKFTVTYTDKNENEDENENKDAAPSERQKKKDDKPREVHPWWVLMVGGLADIVESSLVTSLAEECRVEDTSWIEPGVSSWIYWAYNHSSKDFERVKEYTDLAVAMGWPYTLIDWEWDQMANGGDINDAVAYARQQGVKVNLWYNSGTSWVGPWAPGPQDRLRTKEAREKEMAHLEEMGVSGIKVDFFNPDGREMVDYYLDILEDAARHHLLVDFHGCTIPRGWNRTWPNLMSMEAVYGAEWYNNNGRMTNAAAAHNATLPFTRNVVGPMDYTPCTFTDSQHPHITTDCHELALPILFESGLQHMADRPSAYLGLPEEIRNLLSGLPAAWDETLLLAGYPGESAVIARRAGKKWYVAGINGTEAELTLAPDFGRMGLKKKMAVMLVEDEGDVPGKGFAVQRVMALPSSLTLKARGGFVAVVSD